MEPLRSSVKGDTGSPLAARRDANKNFRINFLEMGVKMIFRGGPSVWPVLSVTSRVCVVLTSVVLGPQVSTQGPIRMQENPSVQTPPAPCPQPTQLPDLGSPTLPTPW